MPAFRRPALFTARTGLALLLLAGCDGDTSGSRDIRIAVIDDPAAAARLEALATRPTLVGRDADGRIVAGLATSWRFVDDGRGLILRLRPVKWPTGRALESRDVVAAFRAAATRREPALLASGITAGNARRGQAGVLAPISRVVELRLDRPSPQLLDWLAEPGLAVMPRRGQGPGNDGLGAYRGSGPAATRRLQRADEDPDPAARAATITIATLPGSAAIAAFRRGDVDIVVGNGIAGLGEARSAAPPRALRIDALWGLYGFRFGTGGAMADPRVRQALLLLADRAAAAGQLTLAGVVPTVGLLPPGVGPGNAPASGDAAALLASAGFGPKQPLRLRVRLPAGVEPRRIAEAATAGWAAAGIEVTLLPATAARPGAAADLVLESVATPAPDPIALLGLWRCRTGGYCNRAADALLATAAAKPGDAAAITAAEAAYRADPPFLPLFGALRWALVAPGVEGWIGNRAGVHPPGRLSRAR